MELEPILPLRVLPGRHPLLILNQYTHLLLLYQILDVKSCVALPHGRVVQEGIPVQGVNNVDISITLLTQDLN